MHLACQQKLFVGIKHLQTTQISIKINHSANHA
jgi:hypothetical protein